MEITKRIVQFRQKKGYSTTKLAKLAGIAQSTLRDIELGKTSPTWDTIKKLCTALEISQLDLLSPDSTDTQSQPSPPEVRRIMEKVRKLPPKRLQILETVLDDWIESD
jgi:transcriptional regulator with XRE-family HTH domain